MPDSRLATHLLLASLAVSAQSVLGIAASKKATPKVAQEVRAEDWPVWGGKNRDFLVNSSGLADSWPAAGPKKLWSRTLGDGYSAIAAEGGILYTAFRRGSKDVVTALDAASGKTRWEYEYENPFTNSFSEKVGPGPYAMPQVVGDRVVTASGTGKIHSLDKKTGRPVWSHNLYTEFDGTPVQFGYSCHALPYKNTLIYMSGGRGDGAIAFRQTDGAVVWKALEFTNSYSSHHEHKTPYGIAVSTPVWAAGNLLFVASAYGTGARVLRLNQANGQTKVKELWADPHIQLHFGTAIQRDGYVYLSSGYDGPVFMTAVELKTGAIKWRDRGFAKAQLLYADGKIILADQDGTLALCKVSPAKFEVLSKASVLESIAWTPPTLVGTRLYVRDRKTIEAFDLGR